MDFKVVSKYKPTGDQPEAIKELSQGVNNGEEYQTLLGVTGSGKTFTVANVVQEVNKPTVKTTAAKRRNFFIRIDLICYHLKLNKTSPRSKKSAYFKRLNFTVSPKTDSIDSKSYRFTVY